MFLRPLSNFKFLPYKIFISVYLIAFNAPGVATETDQRDITLSSLKIHITQNQLEQAGIEYQKLTEQELNPELTTFARVVSIQKLLDIKNQLAIESHRYETAKINFAQAQETLNRLLSLYKNKAISKRKLQIQQNAWRSKKSILVSTQLQKEAIIENLKLNWGNSILNWITNPDDNNLTRIISGDQALLSLTLPINKTLEFKQKIVFVDPLGDRTRAKQAKFISSDPQSHQSSQRESYFFTAEHGFRAGLHLTAWLPQQKSVSGVIIPPNAIIWHLGQTFVYQQLKPDVFTRYRVSKPFETPLGLFLSDDHLIGKTIVIVGAQTLLSEELKSRIPDEDDD